MVTETTSKSTTSTDPVAEARVIIARVLAVIVAIAALALAVGAILVLLKANGDNPLVKLDMHLADFFDIGIFSRTNGIKQFSQPHADIKDAVFNWGLGAIVWLIVGRIVVRIVKP